MRPKKSPQKADLNVSSHFCFENLLPDFVRICIINAIKPINSTELQLFYRKAILPDCLLRFYNKSAAILVYNKTTLPIPNQRFYWTFFVLIDLRNNFLNKFVRVPIKHSVHDVHICIGRLVDGYCETAIVRW